MDRMSIIAKTQKRHEGKSERRQQPPSPSWERGLTLEWFSHFYKQSSQKYMNSQMVHIKDCAWPVSSLESVCCNNMSAIMATILNFSKTSSSAKLQQIFLNIVANICLQLQI